MKTKTKTKTKNRDQVYRFKVLNDTPHCITKGIFDVNNLKNITPREIEKMLPKRVIQFMNFRMDNSEAIAIDSVTSIQWLHDQLQQKEDYQDITCKINSLNIVTLTYTPPSPTPDNVMRLECMEGHGDGAHCGLTDWYPEIERGIQQAFLNSEKDWTTGWYSSKKEIASARISKLGNIIHIEVSVSDDFDTNGAAWYDIKFTKDLKKIQETIYKVWDMAENDLKTNSEYLGYSIGNRKNKNSQQRKNWIYTYLVNTHGLEKPTGDNYSKFGWQEKTKIPIRVKNFLKVGMEAGDKKICCDNWIAEQWE